MSKNEITAPIYLQNEMTSFLHNAYFISVILSNQNLFGWYYEHFIQIVGQYWGDRYRLDYLDTSRTFGDLVETVELQAEAVHTPDHLIEIIWNSLQQGRVISIFSDEYYLSSKSSYQKRHFIHGNLIYGLNKDDGILYSIGYNKNHIYDKVTLNINEFIQSFFSEFYDKSKNSTICSYKCRSFANAYPFSLNRFVEQLTQFTFSIPDTKKGYFYLGDQQHTLFGLSIYDDFIEILDHKKEKKVELTAFHLLFEHKKLLNKRFNYIISNFFLPESAVHCLTRYQKIEHLFAIIRNSYMKEILKTHPDFFHASLPPTSINDKLIRLIQEAKLRRKQSWFLSWMSCRHTWQRERRASQPPISMAPRHP